MGKLRSAIIDGLTLPDKWQIIRIAVHEESQIDLGQRMAHHLTASLGSPPCLRGADDLTFCLLSGEAKERWPIGAIMYQRMY